MDNLNKSGEKPVELEDTNFITLLKNPCNRQLNRREV